MCPSVKRLDIRALGKGHRSLSEAVLVRAVAMTTRLLDLDISGCNRLEHLHLNIPTLRKLAANNCASLVCVPFLIILTTTARIVLTKSTIIITIIAEYKNQTSLHCGIP